MPISIGEAQRKAIDSGFLNDIGEGRTDVRLGITESLLAQYGEEFMLNLGKYANQRKVVASGKLLSDSKVRIVEGTTMQIVMPDYFDYPNEGVQGVKSSKNAPGSPYKFKSYGMNAEGRKSIKDYIRSGHAKINTVRKDKALGIGLEKKRLSVADVQANTLIYLIKRFGIKKTSYFTDALKETFKDFEVKMSEAVGRDIIFTLEKLNRGNSNK